MSEPQTASLVAMADEVGRVLGRSHPGRSAFSALSRAEQALRTAARQVADFERAYGAPQGLSRPRP